MSLPTLASPAQSALEVPITAADGFERPRAAYNGQHLIQLFLIIATFITTTLVGIRYVYDFAQGNSPLTSDTDVFPFQWAWDHLGSFSDGLPFSLTLLGILLTHEFAHYIACRAYGVECTLPFVFPAPTLSGTFGAVIRIKSRMKSRAAVMVIGASGPIAGFCVALVSTWYGLTHSPLAARRLTRVDDPGRRPGYHDAPPQSSPQFPS